MALSRCGSFLTSTTTSVVVGNSSSCSSSIVLLSLRSFASTSRSSLWAHLEEAPFDSNHETNAAFEKDTSSLKVNLGRGVYKDDNGKNWTLPSVLAAEKVIFESKSGHEYLPFKGLAEFGTRTAEFAFGKDAAVLKDKRVATVQSVSGTGALRVGAEFLAKYLPPANLTSGGKGKPFLYLSDPSYVNHFAIFRTAGFEVVQFRYYDRATNRLDIEGMLEDLRKAPKGAVLLLHASAHNPTGVDPSQEEWRRISKVAQERELVCFFDSAYQGFASGDPDRDGWAYRYFVEQGHQVLVAQSYSKNFGLYGQRVGALNVTTDSPKETAAVLSQLNQVIRPMYSNPPLHGARIVATVFGNPEIRSQWEKDVKTMADRINGCRKTLVDNLKALGSKKDWSHITNQIGMFAYSGLERDQVAKLREKHVYMNYDGRMSVSGINSKNVEYLAKAMHEVTK